MANSVSARLTTPPRRVPGVTRLSNVAALTDLCNDLTAFHAHLPAQTTPQAVFDAVADAHDGMLRALRMLRHLDEAPAPLVAERAALRALKAAEARGTDEVDPRAMTPVPF